MTTIDSSSLAQSSMEDGCYNGYTYTNQTLTKRRARTTASAATTATASHLRHGGSSPIKTKQTFEKQSMNHKDGEEDAEEEGDTEVWGALSSSFEQVQSVLDRNRVLIQQVDENHSSKIPENLAKNVALIQEINGNISKVVSLYSDLSSDFSRMYRDRNVVPGAPQ